MVNWAVAAEQKNRRYPGLFARQKIHFVGAGGVGMQRLLEILQGMGSVVSGSDTNPQKCEHLRQRGFKIFTGHARTNVPWDVDTMVYSSAVPQDNPELLEARRRGLRLLRRGDVLADLSKLFLSVVICGAHGKTSTTALTYEAVNHAGLSSLLYLGGTLARESFPQHVGREDCFIVEADESDRSFLSLKAAFPVVTNIDNEHLSAYESFEELSECFFTFLSQTPFYGAAVICLDDPILRSFVTRLSGSPLTYGFHPEARLRAVDLRVIDGRSHFQVWLDGVFLIKVSLPCVGAHQVQNSLVPFAVGHHLGLDPSLMAEGLSNFSGIGRRCELIGEYRRARILSDYAHHPVEIQTTLEGLITYLNKPIHVVFQPHRYSRTQSCWEQFLVAFKAARSVTLLDIYAAGEVEIEDVTSSKLASELQHDDVLYCSSFDQLPSRLATVTRPGDLVVFMGAGSIDGLARELVSE